MSVLLSCPEGHQWEVPEDRVDSDTCPVCGSAGETVIEGDTSLSAANQVDDLPPPPRMPAAAALHKSLPTAVAGDELPERFGRYRIVEPLGRGGMGTVYLAHDSQLDRKVALKIPRFSGGGEIQRERFQREARAAATLDHPHICSVYDVGEFEGIQFLSMAYIEGQPLSGLIKDRHPLPQHAVADLVRKLALALNEAHARGVVHRDLKPANIMVNKRNEPVIMDFGLARRENASDARLTAEGAVMGTPAYMAPEQVAGETEKIGTATDIYALGVILYELLTGRLPFEGSVSEVMAKISTQSPAPPSQYRSDIHPTLEFICLKAINKKADDRFASMHVFAAALQEYLGEKSKSPSPMRAAGADDKADLADESGSIAMQLASDSALTSDDLATDLLAKLAAKLDSVQKVQDAHADTLKRRATPWWVYGGAVAIVLLLVSLAAYLANLPRSSIVTVKVTQIDVWIERPGVTFSLDGKPVSAEQVNAGLAVAADREHKLVVRQSGQIVAERVFTPATGEPHQVIALNAVSKRAQPTGNGASKSKGPRIDGGAAKNPPPKITVHASMSFWTSRYYGAENPFASKLTINGTPIGTFANDTQQNIAKYLIPGLNTIVFDTKPDHSTEAWNSLNFAFGPAQKNTDGDAVLSPIWQFYNGENWKRDGDRFKHQLDPNIETVSVTMHCYYAGLENDNREIREGDFVLQAKPFYGSSNASVSATIFVNGTPLTSFGNPPRQVVITDLLRKGRNQIKLVSRPVEHVLENNDIEISILGPAEHNTRRDGFEFRPVTWFSSMTGWTRHKKTAQLINTVDESARTIERIVPVYLPDEPRKSGKTPEEAEMMVWTEPYYASTEVPLHSDMYINGKPIGVFTSKTRESVVHALEDGKFNEITLSTVAQFPVSSWNDLSFYMGPAGRTDDGSLSMSRLWWFKNGESWKHNGGRLGHASNPDTDEAKYSFSLLYTGMKYENQEVKKGAYILNGNSYSSGTLPSVTSTIYVNGEPLNTFAGVSRSVVITPLLKVGKNEIKIVTIPVLGQLIDNDINFAIGGPAEYNVGKGGYDYPIIEKFGSLDGWKRNQKTGRLEAAENPAAKKIERFIQLDVKESP